MKDKFGDLVPILFGSLIIFSILTIKDYENKELIHDSYIPKDKFNSLLKENYRLKHENDSLNFKLRKYEISPL